VRLLHRWPIAAAFIIASSSLFAGCGGGGSSATPAAAHGSTTAGAVRHVRDCTPANSPDGCDNTGGFDVPEYVDSTGAGCDPSAPYNQNNPCTLNPSYQEPLQQPVHTGFPTPQCTDIYPGGVMNKKSWHQCFGLRVWYN
jgi:hypothetical protein